MKNTHKPIKVKINPVPLASISFNKWEIQPISMKIGDDERTFNTYINTGIISQKGKSNIKVVDVTFVGVAYNGKRIDHSIRMRENEWKKIDIVMLLRGVISGYDGGYKNGKHDGENHIRREFRYLMQI